jgi:S-adenosylmethionine:tRNA ribosyltransferase-isomerase
VITTPASLLEDRGGQSEVRFSLEPELEAHEPPELRGLRRDQVRMMVLPRFAGAPIHTRFDTLPDFLRPGDLLVVNTSRTLPGLLHAHDQWGEPVEVRLARRRSDRQWDALFLNGRTGIGRHGMLLDFGQDLSARVDERSPDLPFLWQLQFDRCCLDLLDRIYRLGEPVR